MKTILIVDDDRVNLIVAKRLLSKNYEVITADSGMKALELLADARVDLILLDLQMPEMDGLEVMHRLQDNEELSMIPVIFLTADDREETESKCFEMGAVDYIKKPFVPIIMEKRIHRTIELEEYRKNLETRLVEQLHKVTELQDNIIITLANIIESRDGTTGEHVKRTSVYTRFLIEKLLEKKYYSNEINAEMADVICKAASMHDIGKVAIDDVILRKAGKLTTEEFEIMKGHSNAGSEIIRKNLGSLVESEFIDVADKLAKYHHERWDGKGYPTGLKGEEIPLCARILAITDVYDALTAKRPYKEGMSTQAAVDIMVSNEGQFEPKLLELFIEDIDSLKALTDSMFETGIN